MYYRRPRAISRRPRSTKKTIGKKRKSIYRSSPSSKLARFNFSKRRYTANRSIARSLNNISENHLIQTFKVNEEAPQAIQLGAQSYYSGYVLGNVPLQWDNLLVDLQGLSIGQGSGSGQRVGDYVYLKKTHLMVEIDMNDPATPITVAPPVEFRCIVFKQRRATMPAGVNFNPATSLFLDNLGQKIGYQTSGVNGTDLMLQPTNRRDWMILHDKKFTLSHWTKSTNTGYTGHYPSMKRFSLNLGYWKRTHYDNTSLLPDDIDYHYGMIIFSRSLGKDVAASNWEVSVRGTTSFSDN